MNGSGSGHVSEMNRVAEKNRNALNSHDKNRTGRFFKSKQKKINLVRIERTHPLKRFIITISTVVFLTALSYFAIQNYLSYETNPSPIMQETSDISKYLSSMESGKINMNEQDYKGAVEDFEAALKIYPNNSEAQNALNEVKKRLEYQN